MSSGFSAVHFEPVSVPQSRWTETTTSSAPAVSAIHCGSMCHLRKKEGGLECLQFSFKEGVCQLAGWIEEATSTEGSTVQTWRKIAGGK